MEKTITLDVAQSYLLSFIEELAWEAEYKLFSPFIGSVCILQALGRACMLNPSSLLYCFPPERYNDPDIRTAIENLDTRPFYLSLNKDNDSHRLEIVFDSSKHLQAKYSSEIYTDGTCKQVTTIFIDTVEFVKDVREIIIKVFEYSNQDKTFFKKLKVAFNEYKFIGLD